MLVKQKAEVSGRVMCGGTRQKHGVLRMSNKQKKATRYGSLLKKFTV